MTTITYSKHIISRSPQCVIKDKIKFGTHRGENLIIKIISTSNGFSIYIDPSHVVNPLWLQYYSWPNIVADDHKFRFKTKKEMIQDIEKQSDEILSSLSSDWALDGILSKRHAKQLKPYIRTALKSVYNRR